MKRSTIMLLVTLTLLITAMFVSNILLKNEYDRIDKGDIYWTYDKILQQPFRHLHIEGGNVTNIAFEQNKKPSVRVYKNWQGYDNKVVRAFVRNDTLYVKFPNAVKNPYEKEYIRWNTLVRIFSPELLSVNGFDTNFGLFKLKQKSISINLSGRSKLEIESYSHEFDSLSITQRDSSKVVLKMSPELKGKVPSFSKRIVVNAKASVSAEPMNMDLQILPGEDIESASWETLSVKKVDANVRGISLLDLGHAQIDSLDLHISDTSAIILSGRTLRRFKKTRP